MTPPRANLVPNRTPRRAISRQVRSGGGGYTRPGSPAVTTEYPGGPVVPCRQLPGRRRHGGRLRRRSPVRLPGAGGDRRGVGADRPHRCAARGRPGRLGRCPGWVVAARAAAHHARPRPRELPACWPCSCRPASGWPPSPVCAFGLRSPHWRAPRRWVGRPRERSWPARRQPAPGRPHRTALASGRLRFAAASSAVSRWRPSPWVPWAAPALALAATVAGGASWWSRRALGGVTGDVPGAAAVLCECAVLVLAAGAAGGGGPSLAWWRR